VDGEAADAVVLAMPDPQALDILATTQAAEVDACADREWRPALTLYAGWPSRCWEQGCVKVE
jgi:renalase